MNNNYKLKYMKTENSAIDRDRFEKFREQLLSPKIGPLWVNALLIARPFVNLVEVDLIWKQVARLVEMHFRLLQRLADSQGKCKMKVLFCLPLVAQN